MNDQDYKDILKKAVETWGLNAQLDMLVEECAELIKAVNKYKRLQTPESLDHLAEEMADVTITRDQIIQELTLGDNVEEHRDAKTKRLYIRILNARK